MQESLNLLRSFQVTVIIRVYHFFEAVIYHFDVQLECNSSELTFRPINNIYSLAFFESNGRRVVALLIPKIIFWISRWLP